MSESWVDPSFYAALPASKAVPQGNGERVLFVDDEESLVTLGKSMLERLGYRVTTELSSIEVLKTFSAQPRNFDLVITDQTIPYMSGSELAKVLLEIRSDMPLILSRGLQDDDQSGQGARDGHSRISF
jgi:two-component system, cell cycle sensor histidine kinase and response regulator CckA